MGEVGLEVKTEVSQGIDHGKYFRPDVFRGISVGWVFG
jgi:hypothetical protein